jgi:hypothetical protein
MYSLSNSFSFCYRKKEEKILSNYIKRGKNTKPSMGYNNDLKVYQVPFPSSDPLIASRSAKLLNFNYSYCNYFTIKTFFNYAFLILGVVVIIILIQTKFGLNIALKLGPKEGNCYIIKKNNKKVVVLIKS